MNRVSAPGRLVDEGERVHGGLDPVGQPVDVLAALVLDLDQGRPLGLGLDHPGGLAVEEEQVVDPAVALLQGELPDSDAGPSCHVRLSGVLDHPTGRLELSVDVDPGLSLSSEVSVVWVDHRAIAYRLPRPPALPG